MIYGGYVCSEIAAHAKEILNAVGIFKCAFRFDIYMWPLIFLHVFVQIITLWILQLEVLQDLLSTDVYYLWRGKSWHSTGVLISP